MLDAAHSVGAERAILDERSLLDEGAVMAALAKVVDPCSIATGLAVSLVDMGLIRGIDIAGRHVGVTLRLTSPLCFQAGLIVAQVERRLAEIPGVATVECRVDPAAEWLPTMMDAGAQAQLRRLRPSLNRAHVDRSATKDPARCSADTEKYDGSRKF